ncbi:MAG: tetratricopeptide repeat protein [Candidatus Omnitrophica bacterium]|nr:tetratricopeptide repeat protein [Candidatus Omnitrophota bacterium]
MTSNNLLTKNAVKVLLIILAITFLSYLPTLRNNFIYFDDDSHLLENAAIRVLDAQHVQEIFTTTVSKVYVPLTFLSFAIEYHFFKYNPFIYHLNNLLLHLAVTALVFYFALQVNLPLRAAFVAALLFGIHPMHVESVAWVTERKDVLYAFFYMLALCFYWRYLSTRKMLAYALTIVFGLLSILAKPMALSLPLILFVCDWLKKRQFDKWMIIDKIPHFLYIVSIAWITYSLNARVPGENISSGAIIWIWTAMFYISKFFFPSPLVPMYALPQPISLMNPHYLGAAALLIGIAIVAFVWRRNRWLWFALGFYFLSMFFLFRYDSVVDKSIVADRFLYLPCLGICFLVGYCIDYLLKKISKKEVFRKALTASLVLIALMLCSKTFAQTKIWNNSVTFWTHEIKYYPDNAMAYGNRGEAYKDARQYQLALNDFNKSIAVDPKYAESYNSRGQLYGMSGKTDAALNDFLKAIELKPNFDEAYNNLGIVFLMNNDLEKASESFNKALEIDPQNAEAHYNLGDFYLAKGEFDRAFEHFQKLIMINPQSAIGYNKRGSIYGIRKQYDLALADFQRSVALDPRNSEIYKNLGVVFEQKRMLNEALKNYNKALSIDPKYADAYYGRGNVLAITGRYQEAAKDFKMALTINPDHKGAQSSQDALLKILAQ